MNTRNDPPTKRTSWSDCSQISELALLIDAMLPAHREEIVRAAVKFEATSELDTSYIVGEIRSLVVDGVAELFGPVVASKFQNLGQCLDLDHVMSDFASSGDPTTVQLAVCDLIESIASAANVSE